MTRSLRCAACSAPIFKPRPNQRFCNKRCRDRANWRRAAGRPEHDQTDNEASRAQLTKADRQLAGKERTIQRLRQGRQADRARARAAEVAATAETARAERAISSIGRAQHDQRRQTAALREQLAQAAETMGAKDAEIADLRAGLRSYRADAEQREQAERQVPTRIIRRQWEALAVRIARQASGNGLPLAGLDQEVVTTWQRQRQQAPATGSGKSAAPAQPTRPTRPATPPRRRNR